MPDIKTLDQTPGIMGRSFAPPVIPVVLVWGLISGHYHFLRCHLENPQTLSTIFLLLSELRSAATRNMWKSLGVFKLWHLRNGSASENLMKILCTLTNMLPRAPQGPVTNTSHMTPKLRLGGHVWGVGTGSWGSSCVHVWVCAVFSLNSLAHAVRACESPPRALPRGFGLWALSCTHDQASLDCVHMCTCTCPCTQSSEAWSCMGMSPRNRPIIVL